MRARSGHRMQASGAGFRHGFRRGEVDRMCGPFPSTMRRPEAPRTGVPGLCGPGLGVPGLDGPRLGAGR